MESILIKNVSLNGETTDILIQDDLISRIEKNIDFPADKTISAAGLAALPAFYNMHTHTAMTLLRGFADDMPLMKWLQNKIWPQEAKLTPDDIYHGTRFGCLEMIKAGTVLANDMYWHWESEARAASEMGIRFINGATIIDFQDDSKLPEIKDNMNLLLQKSKDYGKLIEFSLAPHAIYTVSEKTLRWVNDFAAKHDLKIHTHIAETEKEYTDCQIKTGLSPVQYLDKIGFLGDNVIAAHMVWLNDKDFDLVKDKGVTVVHCPVSNTKLSSGAFKYNAYKRKGIPVCIATDGASSNNNLDLFEEMKFAALLPKLNTMNPETAPAQEIFTATNINPAQALGLNAGKIKTGYLADIILVDLHNINLIPNHNLISNLVYSAHADCVHTTICNGKILMENRVVPNEDDIIADFNKVLQKII